MKVDTNPDTISSIFERGIIADVVPAKKDLLTKLSSGQQLRFYMGIDVTASSIHLGHAGNLLLLEDFRLLGHEIVVLLGDFTARIGDPSGKEKTRKEQSKEEIEKNITSLAEQIRRVVSTNGDNPALIKRNSEWLSGLTVDDIIELTKNFTVQQMIERDMFQKRIAEKSPIHLHEFLYPLLQGYDSVALETDVEVGGSDQLFNMLAGRTLLERMKGKSKFIITTNLLQNPRTGVLMSKSEGTGVFLEGKAEQMFGSIMSQEDGMIGPLLVHATRTPMSQIGDILSQIKKGGETARDAKLESAYEIVRTYHSENDAKMAKNSFISTYSKGDLSNIPEIKLPYSKERLFIALVDAGLAESNTEARRLIEEGAVEIGGVTIRDPNTEVEILGVSVRVGKHRFARLVS